MYLAPGPRTLLLRGQHVHQSVFERANFEIFWLLLILADNAAEEDRFDGSRSFLLSCFLHYWFYDFVHCSALGARRWRTTYERVVLGGLQRNK